MLWPIMNHINVIFSISLMKLMLLPSYYSTDFEVHRNWLAITNTLPVREWYYDETSQWTLDYPPVFAFFEFILSHIAYHFDPNMLVVANLNYSSASTVLFQRLSVILTDLLFAYSLSECVKEVKKSVGKSDLEGIFLIIFANAGMILVDHIHFQYNGFLFGVLFLSITRILQGREIEGSFWFALLLNLKHIYLYIAPAYFVFLLRAYCFGSKTEISWSSFSFLSVAKLGSVVVLVFTLSFGPFIAIGQHKQLISRLFPFKRGLSHAYWAPNFWAFYNAVDKWLVLIGTKLKLLDKTLPHGSMTRGLVQEYEHIVLPSVTPLVTFVLTFLSVLPCLYILWRSTQNRWQFLRALTLCGFSSFLFGWHVHEKAILLVILPLGLLCHFKQKEAILFLFLSSVGHFSLFPLLFTSHETVLKVVLLLLHAVMTSIYLRKVWGRWANNSAQFSWMETIYLCMLVPLFLYEQFLHRLLGLEETLPFLPLMLISVYCSVGVIYSWLRLYHIMLFESVKKDRAE